MIEDSDQRTYEARAWLTEHPTGFAGNGVGAEDSPLAFVEILYRAGATEVQVSVDEERQLATTMLVSLPEALESRQRLFSVIHAEEERCSEEFCVTPNGKPGRTMTADEARELGDPDLEGEWLEEAGPSRDVGQVRLELWWD